MSGWTPIETYPLPPFNVEKWYMPGERVLLCDKWIFIGEYSYTERGKGRWRDAHDRACAPTHWMPLPDPPDAAAKVRQEPEEVAS